MATSDSITGTSTRTPTTVARAAPEFKPNKLIVVVEKFKRDPNDPRKLVRMRDDEPNYDKTTGDPLPVWLKIWSREHGLLSHGDGGESKLKS